METVNKKELVRRTAYQVGANAEVVNEMTEAFVEEIRAAVAKGEQVSIAGFGIFEGRERSARTARNPQNGEPVPVPARTVPVFRPSSTFRRYVIAVTSGEPTEEF